MSRRRIRSTRPLECPGNPSAAGVDIVFPWCAPAPVLYDQKDQFDVDRRYRAVSANVTKDACPFTPYRHDGPAEGGPGVTVTR
jgi:hypothetical protein